LAAANAAAFFRALPEKVDASSMTSMKTVFQIIAGHDQFHTCSPVEITMA